LLFGPQAVRNFHALRQDPPWTSCGPPPVISKSNLTVAQEQPAAFAITCTAPGVLVEHRPFGYLDGTGLPEPIKPIRLVQNFARGAAA